MACLVETVTAVAGDSNEHLLKNTGIHRSVLYQFI